MIRRAALASLMLCLATPAVAADAPPPVAFRATMDALAAVLTTLLPEALDRRPVDEARAARIKESVASLERVTGELARLHGADLPDADPTLGVIFGELGRAVADVRKSKPDRLPQTALSVASTCLACHTRAASVSKDIGLGPVDARLDGDVRADILVATRRFDDARRAYRGVVFDEAFATAQPWRFERAARRALALEVRVMEDPAQAKAIAVRVLETPSAEALWPAADAWRADLSDWSSEPKDEPPLARAARLMNDALAERTPRGDAQNEVLFLRATAAIHSALSSSSPMTLLERAQALSWLGIAYGALAELDVWGLFLAFDAACVEAAPKTALARSCLARYERAVVELYGGTGGVTLPPEQEQQLRVLRRTAR